MRNVESIEVGYGEALQFGVSQGTYYKEPEQLLTEAYEAGKRDTIPEGWVLVPVAPTGAMGQKMLMALLEYSAGDCDELSHKQYIQYSADCTRVYKAALAAAPKGER